MSEIPSPIPTPEGDRSECTKVIDHGMDMYTVTRMLNGESFTFTYQVTEQGDAFWKYSDGSSDRIALNPEETKAAERIVEQLKAGRNLSDCPSQSRTDAPLADS